MFCIFYSREDNNSLQPPLLPAVDGLDVGGRDGKGQHEVVRVGLLESIL
jgi:hypothetical protein